MLYILEGNECCFKTTTAELLSNATGYPIIKGSSFELSSCTNTELFNKFLEFAEMDDIIFDRFIWSNLIYANIYKDFSILTDDQRKYISDLIKDKSQIIYLHAPNDVIKSRLRSRGDDYVNEDKIDTISYSYNAVMNQIDDLQVWSFDTSQIDGQGIVELLLA